MRNKRILSYLICAVLLLQSLGLSSCGAQTRYLTDTFLSMDTVITVSLAPGTPDVEKVFSECRRLCEEQRLIFDADDANAETARFNAAAGAFEASEPLLRVVKLADSVARATHGAFDYTLYPVTQLWRAAQERGSLPTAAEMTEALSRTGYEGIAWNEKTLTKREGQSIDLGGIGKGAAEAALLGYLRTCGAAYGVLSFGGNIAVFGKKTDGTPFSVALRDPVNTAGTLGTLRLNEGFVSVSGDYERFYEIEGGKYPHILDGKTGMPADSGLHSVAVICSDGALGDALSTALFVLGSEAGVEFWRSGQFDFEAVFISDGKILITEGLDGFFECTGNYSVETIRR